jgi:hypothetical protein
MFVLFLVPFCAAINTQTSSEASGSVSSESSPEVSTASIATSKAKASPRPQEKISSLPAKELATAYNVNEIDADLKFKGNVYDIAGIVFDVDYSSTSEQIYVVLDAPGFSTVKLTLIESNFQKRLAAQLRRGMTATIRGRVTGSNGMSAVNVENAEIILIAGEAPTQASLQEQYSDTLSNQFMSTCIDSFQDTRTLRKNARYSCECGFKAMKVSYSPSQFNRRAQAIVATKRFPPDEMSAIVDCQFQSLVADLPVRSSSERELDTVKKPDGAATPQGTCGDQKADVAMNWYPVFIDGGDLEQIRSQYCSDAYTTTRQLTGRTTVQVASFSSYDRAKAFADRVGGEVGEPRLR